MSKEIWKDIKDYEGVYQISDRGRVKSLARFYTRTIKGTTFNQNVRERILKACDGGNGYLAVNLKKNKKPKTNSVHVLVSEAFIYKSDKNLIVNHKDGNKLNNNVDNLEWVTYSRNAKHALETGLIIPLRGEEVGASKLKEGQVIDIMKLHEQGTLNKDIAKIYGVDNSTISRIVTKVYWSHLWKK